MGGGTTIGFRDQRESGDKETRVTMDRRMLLKAAARGAAATPLLFLASKAQADNQLSQEQAQYRDQPNGNQMCSACANFIQPSGCKLVSGQVSPDGWCKLFQAKSS